MSEHTEKAEVVPETKTDSKSSTATPSSETHNQDASQINTPKHKPSKKLKVLILMLVVIVVGGLTAAGIALTRSKSSTADLTGINKIKHIVIIMQENRSFDSYFGTFPGADGIPMKNG